MPTLELKEGVERGRLVAIAQRFCESHRIAGPEGAQRLFVASVREAIPRLPPDAGGGRYLTSRDPGPRCEPGRSWYRGGSRQFVEVRMAGGSDRLDLWRGEMPLIRNILYGRPRPVGGGKADSLAEALLLARPAPAGAGRTAGAAPSAPLTGRYSQTGAAGWGNPPCENLQRIGELEFGADGRFAVTFVPFESYRDYWGTYRYDPLDGSLELTVEGGNSQFARPAGKVLTGKAYRNEAGRLVLEGFNLGNGVDWVVGEGGVMVPGTCTYIF